MSKYEVPGIDGTPLTTLNRNLAERQKVTDEQLEALKLSHQLRWMLFETAKKTKEPLKLKMLAALYNVLETEQQKLWNFPLDPNFHRFFDFPGCLCPRMDNIDALGTAYRVHVENCPIHGFQPMSGVVSK
jgi:hypothetical protein